MGNAYKYIYTHTRLLIILIVLAASAGTAASAESISGSGCSVSTVGYLVELAKEYERETGVTMLVRGGGSVVGLNDLHTRRVDFAASCQSRSSSDPEDFEFITVAWDALVFIVHPSNAVSNIKYTDVRNIYEGMITNWKQLGGPDQQIKSFISTEEGMGGIGESLSKMILEGKRPEQQRNSSMQASSAAIWEQLVEKTPEGFASTGFASARKRKVKMLAVNGVMPSKENIITGAYRLKRPLYLVVKKDAKPQVRRFIKFVLSRKGQALISSYGIPSLVDLKR
jgi:phosphate transport system substrate-binding protein